jgi:hypothetical protein
MEPVRFPWEEAIDHKEAVGSFDAYLLSMRLSREGIICGPSTGFNLKGWCLWLFHTSLMLIIRRSLAVPREAEVRRGA